MKKQSLLSVMLAVFMITSILVPQFIISAENSDSIEPGITEEIPEDETQRPPAGMPEFALENIASFEMEAGTTRKFRIYISNVSKDTSTGTNLIVTPENNSIDIHKTMIFSGYISGGSTMNAEIEVTVPKSLPAGRYNLELKITGSNLDRKSFTQTLPFYIIVSNGLTDNSIIVSDYQLSKPEISPNDKFTLTLTLENSTNNDIKGILLDIEGLDGSRFAMDQGLSLKKLDLKKGEKKQVKYNLIATKGISSIREILVTKMIYQPDEKNAESKQESSTNITIPCKPVGNADGSDKVFAPNIIIDSYTYGDSFVTAGKTFPLNITIRNTSSTVNIENLKVTIQGASGSGSNGVAFSPANSSNSFFFNKLPVNASKNIQLDMLAKADAVPDSYPIEVTFDYEYTANGSKDKASPVTETLSIPLQQNDRFTANTPELPPDCMVGDEVPVSLTFINKGKSAVYNVTVDVAGEGFEKTSSAYYIGNVESGTEEFYDTRIIPTMEGEVKGEIVVTYEDANGNEKELRVPFQTIAMPYDMPPMDGENYPGGEAMYPPDMEFDENGNPIGPTMSNGVKLPTWAIIAICAGGVVIVIVVIIVIVKLRSRKKLAAMLAAEAEDDNENN